MQSPLTLFDLEPLLPELDGKQCTICHLVLPLWAFAIDARYLGGVYHRCGKCTSKHDAIARRVDYGLHFGLQHGRCAACGEPPAEGERFHKDIDHETWTFRGLVHQKCNVAFGMAQESPARIVGLLRYLAKHSPEKIPGVAAETSALLAELLAHPHGESNSGLETENLASLPLDDAGMADERGFEPRIPAPGAGVIPVSPLVNGTCVAEPPDRVSIPVPLLERQTS